jgi:NitT/TauT family transport system substrate-binding protein
MEYFCNNRNRILFACILTALILPACRKHTGNPSITIGALNGPSGLSLVKLMDENASEIQYPADFVIRNDPELIKAMMIREEVELALVPFTMAALLYNHDFPYQLVGVPVWGSLFLVGSDSTIQNVGDLKGKTIHSLPRNMTPDIILRYILSKNAIDPDKDLALNYTFTTPLELSAALQSNRISIGIVSEPMMSRILMKNQSLVVLFDLAELWDEIHQKGQMLAQTALLVHKDWALENPEILHAWCEKYAAAIDWTNSHHEEAGVLAVEQKIARKANEVSEAIPRCRLEFHYASDQKEELLKYLNLLFGIDPKIIGGRIPDDEFFYSK